MHIHVKRRIVSAQWSPASWLVMLATLVTTIPTQAELSGTWDQELAYATNAKGEQEQKFEALVEPEWYQAWDNSSLTVRLRLRHDTVGALGPSQKDPDNFATINGPWYNNNHTELTLRELYVDGSSSSDGGPDWSWRLGKQQVVWGQADGLKVLDVVNPQSYREFILDQFEDSRIPLWMANVNLDMADAGSIQLLWIPDTSTHELAEPGTPFQMTTPLLVPRPLLSAGQRLQINSAHSPSNGLKDGDAGIKYAVFFHGWDLTLNYLYHFLDTPVYYHHNVGDTLILAPKYRRNHLFGGTASNAFGDFTLRAEMGWNSDRYFLATDISRQGIHHSSEWASVFGLDWQGLSDTLISLQWFQSYLQRDSSELIRDRWEQAVSLLARHSFVQDTWQVELLSLYNLNDQDGVVRPRMSHLLFSELSLWFGADIFFGPTQGLYGQFDHQDRVVLGFELGF